MLFREASGEDATKKKPVDSEKDALKSRKQMEDSRQVRYESHRLFANFMFTLNPLFTHGAIRKLLVNSSSGHHEGKGFIAL